MVRVWDGYLNGGVLMGCWLGGGWEDAAQHLRCVILFYTNRHFIIRDPAAGLSEERM
jgi:hypothetical protein